MSVEQLNIPYADLSPALTERAEAKYLRYAPRWSPTGHYYMAESMTRFLVVKIPGPWNGRYPQQGEPQIGNDRAPRSPVQWAGGTQYNFDR